MSLRNEHPIERVAVQVGKGKRRKSMSLGDRQDLEPNLALLFGHKVHESLSTNVCELAFRALMASSQMLATLTKRKFVLS